MGNKQNIIMVKTDEWKNKAAEDLTHTWAYYVTSFRLQRSCVKHHLLSSNRD